MEETRTGKSSITKILWRGKYAYVTLPQPWVKDMLLKHGDYLRLYLEEGRIIMEVDR